MREIKFRAWDGERLRAVWGLGWIDGEMDYIITPKFSGPAEDCKLMQYTGLTDKNGIEIYEGDIVQVYGHKDLIVRLGKHAYDTRDLLVGGLYREVYGFYIESKCGSWQCNISVVLGGIEIIGNIHENPELLEVSK